MFLYDLPGPRKNVPELIKDPVELIKDVRSLVERHCKDQPELAVSGRPILQRDLNRGNNTVLSSRLQMDQMDVRDVDHADVDVDADDGHHPALGGAGDNGGDFVTPQSVTKTRVYKRNGGLNGGANVPRRRRRRCKTCAPCTSTECGHCTFCLDMVSVTDARFMIHSFTSLILIGFTDQIRWTGPRQTNMYDASVFAAHVTSHRTVCVLQVGWLASAAGVVAAGQTADSPRSRTVDADGMFGVLRNHASGLCAKVHWAGTKDGRCGQ